MNIIPNYKPPITQENLDKGMSLFWEMENHKDLLTETWKYVEEEEAKNPD